MTKWLFHRGCNYWNTKKMFIIFKVAGNYKHNLFPLCHVRLAKMEGWCFFPSQPSSLGKQLSKNLSFWWQFFFDSSKRRMCNPFKGYLCFFSIEISQGLQLRVNISSEKCPIIRKKSGVEYKAEATSSTTSPEKQLLMLAISVSKYGINTCTQKC